MNNDKPTVIMHIDMDAFFASCLQAKYPNLRKKPIVVSYNQSRSMIVTSSYEARAMGVKTGMPLFKAQQLTNNKVIQVNPEFKIFTEYSQQIFSIIYNEFSNILEIASIDECYIDVTDKWQKYGSPKNMAIQIKNTIKERLGISCSIGISGNKFLAKMIGKTNKPDGVSVINPKNYKQYLWNLDIKELFGVGLSISKKMREININTVKDLALYDSNIIQKEFGKYGIALQQNANGVGDDVVKIEHNDYKNISNEITLTDVIYNEDELLDVIHSLTKHVINRAFKRQMISNTFGISVRYKWNKHEGESFNKLKHLKTISKQITLDEHTNEFEIIYPHLKELLLNNYEVNRGVALIGVSLKNVIKIEKLATQLSFKNENVDEINYDVKKILLNHKFKKILKTADQLESTNGKLSEQTKYIKKEEIHFNIEDKKKN